MRFRGTIGCVGIRIASFASSIGILGCACALPDGLALTAEGDGPRVVWELERRPLPELPFPNDIATRPDPRSPTGLRVNASTRADTRLERTARRRLNELTGFGVYQPIQIRFDEPLDLGVFYARHRDYRHDPQGLDYRFDDDVVFLIDVTPGSPTYLEPVPLDFGEGNFPQLLRTPHQYWEHDPKTITRTLAYETYFEDHNHNGVLDPGEDLDLDGVLDFPNLDAREDGNPFDLDPVRDIVSFYEFETNTLTFKPIIPLREGTTYAVVITKDVVGMSGESVRSPFAYVNHTDQTDVLQPVVEALSAFGRGRDDIAFAWSYTTQNASEDLVLLRDGLYGEGPLAWLAEDNPPELIGLDLMLDPSTPDGQTVFTNRYALPNEVLRPIIAPLAEAAFGNFGISGVRQLERNHDFYGYHISGTFRSPRLIDLETSETGNLDEQAWPADLRDPSLRDRIAYHDVQFWCAIPKKEYAIEPGKPAPVVLYAHGYTSNKIEQLGLALHAKFGIAGCSIDAPLHGIDVGDLEDVVRALFAGLGMGPAADALLRGRAEDIDGDGRVDVGAEFFTGYMFKTRDNLRQTLLDWLTLVRLIRTFGEGRMLDVNQDGAPELLGDFDADGVVDFGGPESVFFASGTSLGGLVSSMLAALEPTVVAAAPIAGGAGLVDLTMRSEQGGVVEAIGLRMFGPAIVGEPTPDGRTRFYQLFVNGNRVERRDLAVRAGVLPGNVVMVTNRRTGAARCGLVMPDEPPLGYETYRGWSAASNCAANSSDHCRVCPEATAGTYACDLARTVRVAVPADTGDPLLVEVLGGPGLVEISGDERDCTVVADTTPLARIERFEFPVQYREGVYGEGADLIALESGFGFQRATPLVRKFLGIAQMGIEGADPAVYAPHYSRDPLVFREDGVSFRKRPTNVLNVTTIGDANVPVNTGVAIAKVAGFVELSLPRSPELQTANRILIDEGVQQGIPWLRTRGPEWGPVLVDVDNLSDSQNDEPMSLEGSADGLVAPRHHPPLRLVGPTPGAQPGTGESGLVLPMLNEFNGAHGFPPPGITSGPFDIGQFMEHQIGWYFRTGGAVVRYDACMAELDACGFIPSPPDVP
jgi:hypothetical protein